MYKGRTQFRSPTWLKLFMLVSSALVPVLTVIEYRNGALSWLFFGLLALSVVMIVGLVAVFVERIELDETELRITHNFLRTTVPRANVEKATWEAGCNAILLLKDGGSITLPDVGDGSQSLCNSIRAWAKAT